MKRDQFIRELTKAARTRGWQIDVDMARGKGGHCVVRVNGRFSVVKSGEITPIMAKVIRKQLGLERKTAMQYIARLEPDGDGLLVTFPRVPEAITGGGDEAEALVNAADALEVALLTYAINGTPIPKPQKTATAANERVISISAATAAKLAFIQAFAESKLSRVALARQLGKSEGEVRRMLDPYHATKLPALEAGLRTLGKRLVISVEAA